MALLLYQRDRRNIKFSLQGLTNHELRAVMIGLWLGLDPDDRQDHIRELQHYTDPDNNPPGLSIVIAKHMPKPTEELITWKNSNSTT